MQAKYGKHIRITPKYGRISPVKRIFDILVVLTASPLWLPVMLLTAFAVLLVEGRPVFFLQERAGFKGKPFRIIKFRTMKQGDGRDAERLTRFGRFLRATSLDELPELFHVLSGTMSLVGPRPLPTAYLPRYDKEQMRRHDVRPGITGWAQVHGRNETSWEERFNRDLWYVDNAGLLLDIKILMMTVWQVLAATGINKTGQDTMEEFK